MVKIAGTSCSPLAAALRRTCLRPPYGLVLAAAHVAHFKFSTGVAAGCLELGAFFGVTLATLLATDLAIVGIVFAVALANGFEIVGFVFKPALANGFAFFGFVLR